MSSESRSKGGASEDAGDLEALSEAIESGAGLGSLARGAAAALGAYVAVIDRSSAVLAVAAGSGAEEEKLLAGSEGVETATLRVAAAAVGELRYRCKGEAPAPGTVRMVCTLLALEVERARGPERASDEAASDLVDAVLGRDLEGASEIEARASALGTDLSGGAGVIFVRAHPHAAQTGEWRARVQMLAARAAPSGALVAAVGDPEAGESAEVAVIVATGAAEAIPKAARGIQTELEAALSASAIAVGHSRLLGGAEELYRGGKEALLALNVAEAEGVSQLDFERTGSYRLLLPALSEDPAELERFFGETIAPLAAYDEQYETDLVKTAEAYLDNDGNITPTAEALFTHRHTIRYRLERIKELSGHDLTSTTGRERLGLGLKSMRVLGIAPPRGPASEPGARAGRVRPSGK